ncbi:class III poly(R)-hydroxyalkanoic acid synthase subunit PhaE [Lysobacter koreensis]|uniref:Poly(3-hydroxyalkanoate) polymerase subunit PhaE n=1 Tax=Lysobacter koreensis TaxID=266122 RepID=A0ABW2YHY5_9GAMM
MANTDFDAMARQYWNAWGESMRAAQPPAQPAVPGWDQAIAWWSQLAKGAPGFPGMSAGASGAGHSGVNDTLDRFNSQARGWYAQMQQLAAQFAGQDAGAADIAGAWKQAMGGQGGNPFAEMFSHMQGPGQHGVGQWFEQAKPYLQGLEAWQRGSQSWQATPAFGFAREHQERWQQLAQAQADYQEKTQAYNALMGEAGQRAFEVFEAKLAERSEPGRQLTTARALFDLWIDAAEEAYAKIALSSRFREVYGDLVNSQMRLRAGVQREIEQASGVLGMPTRTEIDSAHRKIVQLERELRRLREAMTERDAAKPVVEPAATKSDVAKPGAVQRVSKRDAAQRAGKTTTTPAKPDRKDAAPAAKRSAVANASKPKGKR